MSSLFSKGIVTTMIFFFGKLGKLIVNIVYLRYTYGTTYMQTLFYIPKLLYKNHFFFQNWQE